MAKSEADQLGTAEILDLLAILPHRYPFLLVDRIINIKNDESAIGIKNVTANEPHFQGHFPQRPIMPGVLIIEGMAQTAGAICLRHSRLAASGALVYFMAIEKARFRKPVWPGDRLEYHVQKQHGRGQVWRFACEAKVEGERVAEAILTAMLADA